MSSQKTEAAHSMSLLGAIATIVGCVIGASIFILIGPIAGKTGNSLYLAYLLAFLPAFFGSMYYAQLGAAIPQTGGSYYYASRLLSPVSGYFVASTLILGGIGANVMLAKGFAQYLQYFFPDLSITLVAVIITVLLALINWKGLRLAELFQIVMTIWIVFALLLFAIPGLWHMRPMGDEPLLAFGGGGLLFAAALAVYSYTGYGIISELGGDIKNPRKNVPIAIFVSIALVTLIYTLVAYVCTGVISWQVLSSSNASLAQAAQSFLPGWAIFIISTGALFATVTTINAIFMTIPREFFALAKDSILSERWLKAGKSGIPTLALLVVTFATLVGILSGLSVDFFATITVVGLLFNAVLVGFAAWRLPKKAPQAYESAAFKLPGWALKGSIFFGIVLNICFIALALADAPAILLVYVIWLLCGYGWVRKRLKSLGNDLESSG